MAEATEWATAHEDDRIKFFLHYYAPKSLKSTIKKLFLEDITQFKLSGDDHPTTKPPVNYDRSRKNRNKRLNRRRNNGQYGFSNQIYQNGDNYVQGFDKCNKNNGNDGSYTQNFNNRYQNYGNGNYRRNFNARNQNYGNAGNYSHNFNDRDRNYNNNFGNYERNYDNRGQTLITITETMATIVTIGVDETKITLLDLITLNVTILTREKTLISTIISAVMYLIRVDFQL